MRNGGNGIRMGWKPDTGFSGFGSWVGYNEAMILYLLALGSPTHPVPWYTWDYWTSGYNWGTQYGQTYLIFPPLFGHQYSHCWIDFRDIQDDYMRLRGITYFENSRRATLAAREYCIDNPVRLDRLRREPVGPDRLGRSRRLPGPRRAAGPERQRHDHADGRGQFDRLRARGRHPRPAQHVRQLRRPDLGHVRLQGRLQPDAVLGRQRTTSASTRARSSS